MSNIAFTKYIDITSSVAGSSTVSTRELILRIFTNNILLPSQSYVEYLAYQLPQIGTYFGTTSQEYLRAQFYFNYVNKNNSTTQKISFARWVDADTPPMIFGSKAVSLSAFQAITDGSFTLEIGGVTHLISGLDFSAAVSYANVATIIQAGINAESGIQWTAATVSYQNTTTSFNFVGGDAVAATISVTAGTLGTDISILMGWGANAVFSDGSLVETLTETLTNSANASDNFGSFIFIPALTLSQITEAAAWNTTQNNLYQYQPITTQTNASSYSAALITYGGTGLNNVETLPTNNYVEMLPCCILAATDFTRPQSVQNYMYQAYSALTPTVTDTAISDTLDIYRVNYYGQTQTSGQNISFYQQGILMGGPTDALDMGVYANEQWLKAAVSAALITLLLNSPYVPANDQGIGVIMGTIQEVINVALVNGTISIGKILTSAQKASITNLSGETDAWYQVQNIGYWLNCIVVPVSKLDAYGNNVVTYQADYTLIYSKNDAIRQVQGSHILI